MSVAPGNLEQPFGRRLETKPPFGEYTLYFWTTVPAHNIEEARDKARVVAEKCNDLDGFNYHPLEVFKVVR